jgi:Skp family chaperone for outer membrane proteins
MRLIRALMLVLLAAGPVNAQESPPANETPDAQQPGGDLLLGLVQSPVLTIDPDRLFAESLFGKRVAADLRVEAEALDAENQRIETELTEEERDLTLRRPTMPVEDFRIEAEAFDVKVQGIRDVQDAKERSLQEAVSERRATFLEAVTPLLAQIMRESNAAVILDRRSVFLGAGVVDITDRAIAAVNAQLGDGTTSAAQDPTQTDPADPDPVPDRSP